MKLLDIILDAQANGLPAGTMFIFEKIEVYNHKGKTFVKITVKGIIMMTGSIGHSAISSEIHIPLESTSYVSVNCNTVIFDDKLTFDVAKNGRIWAVQTPFCELAKAMRCL